MSTVRSAPQLICDDAEFRADGVHRYWLSRSIAAEGPVGLFLALNPSTAGAIGNDATVRKWKGFATRWGWLGFLVGNLFSFVEIKSALLRNLAPYHANDDNSDTALISLIMRTPHIVLCWGNNVPKHLHSRVSTVLDLLSEHQLPETTVSTFGLSKSGQPMHPLMLSYDTQLVSYTLAKRLLRRERE